MVTTGSENGRYFELNRVNRIRKPLYLFETIPTVQNITGFDEVETLMMSFPVFTEFTFRA